MKTKLSKHKGKGPLMFFKKWLKDKRQRIRIPGQLFDRREVTSRVLAGFELRLVLINILSEILERKFMCSGNRKINRIVKPKTEKLRS